jgi:hypothetical protein
LRKSAAVFPLNYQFRKASAIALASIALTNDSEPLWKEAALPELLQALKIDPTAADLLAPLITFELDLHKDRDAQSHYAMFKRVAKNSPLNGLVHQTTGAILE